MIEVDCEVKPVTAAVLKVLNADNQRELQLCMQDLMNLIRQKYIRSYIHMYVYVHMYICTAN